MKTVGEIIRELRGTASRRVFAKKYGIHPVTLERYETGKRTPPVSFLVDIADGEGQEMRWLDALNDILPPLDKNNEVKNLPEEKNCTPRSKDHPVSWYEAFKEILGSLDGNKIDATSPENKKCAPAISPSIKEIGQPAKKTNDDDSQNAHQTQILQLQQEIIGLLKDKTFLTSQTSNLRVEIEKLRLRNKELEKEIERLRGELSLAKSQASGVQAG